MIIFGVRNKLLKNPVAQPMLLHCDYCQSGNTVQAYWMIKYLHIFWIPMFPYGKQTITVCTHCKKTKYPQEFTQNDLQQLQTVGYPKTPLKYYTGLILIGLFFALVMVTIMIQGYTAQ